MILSSHRLLRSSCWSPGICWAVVFSIRSNLNHPKAAAAWPAWSTFGILCLTLEAFCNKFPSSHPWHNWTALENGCCQRLWPYRILTVSCCCRRWLQKCAAESLAILFFDALNSSLLKPQGKRSLGTMVSRVVQDVLSQFLSPFQFCLLSWCTPSFIENLTIVCHYIRGNLLCYCISHYGWWCWPSPAWQLIAASCIDSFATSLAGSLEQEFPVNLPLQ